jgi:hypothetical protein
MRFWKPLSVLAMALTVALTTITAADAGGRRYQRHHNHNHSGNNLAVGLVTGLVAGAVLYNATRPRYYSPGVSYSTSPGYDAEVCYRGPKQCHSRWNCWVNYYGNEVCEKQVACSRPLICE